MFAIDIKRKERKNGENVEKEHGKVTGLGWILPGDFGGNAHRGAR